MFWLTLSKLKSSSSVKLLEATSELERFQQRLFDPASISGLDVTPDYTKDNYRQKIEAHLADLRDCPHAAGMGDCLLMTVRPLDAVLRGGRN
jgi:hypothetical protein